MILLLLPKVSAIHGDFTAEERERIMGDFRSGNSRVLISTDLLSGGIDVEQVSIVINYDLPSQILSIGRGGRFGRKGELHSISLLPTIKK